MREPFPRERLEVERAAIRVDEVGAHHRVEGEGRDLRAVPAQEERVVRHVLADLPDSRIGQRGAQRLERVLEGHLRGRPQVGVAHGDVDRVPFARAHREPDDLRAHRIDGRGLEVDGQRVRLPQRGGEARELVAAEDRAVFFR